MSCELLLAFFSPGLPSLLFVIPVTTELKIVPVSDSNLLLVDFSNISCPNAPNVFVFASI